MSTGKPALDRLSAKFGAKHRLFRDAVPRAYAQFGDTWANEFDDLLDRLFPAEADLALAAAGYAAFALDALRRQDRFDRDGKYPEKSFVEASAEVYLNADYMRHQYLPGLLLSHYLWGHHYRQLRFFRDAFLTSVARCPNSFLEVGIGTGTYSRSLLAAIPGLQGAGFDISPYSKAFAEYHLGQFDLLSRYRTELRNVIESPPDNPCAWLICVEVLEHLEDPDSFLRALRGLLTSQGKAFITAALNAANADHIYLYRNPEQVAQQLMNCGFAIEQYFVANAYHPLAPARPVPAVAAFVVTRQDVR